jgi:hypothetical protein
MDNGSVDPDEILVLLTRSARDEDGNGIFDIQEDDFSISSTSYDPDTGMLSLHFNSTQGYTYYVQRSANLGSAPSLWINMTDSPDTTVIAESDTQTISFPHTYGSHHFFRVVRMGQN